MSCLLYFSRETTNWEGLSEELFKGCVLKREEQQVNKENQMGFLSFDDFIRNDNRSNKDISSYFKEVKIKELRIWKGDMRRCQATMSDDGHLLLSEESRKKNFQELRETKIQDSRELTKEQGQEC